MSEDDSDKIVPIGAARSSTPSSPLTVIMRRRHNIQTRIAQIDAEISAIREERNALFREDQALAQAEGTVRKLLERKS